MSFCKKCGKEFQTHGRPLRLCPVCRSLKDIPKAPKLPKSPEIIAAWNNGLPTNDFRYYSEELHRCGKDYALYCEGGPMSKYCNRTGQDTSYGNHIEHFSAEQVKLWMESHDFNLDPLEKV